MTDFIVIIPARHGSTRFPGKPLVLIHQKPMIQHVYERAIEAGASRVIVATDDGRIVDAVKAFDGEYCMTGVEHESGTERLAEVIQRESINGNKIIVNVQGDEPFIPAENIRQVADNLAQYSDAQMATLSTPITEPKEVFNPNAVKVITDKNGYAMYFSRSPLPYDRARFMDTDNVEDIGDYHHRHIGIYAYRAEFIKQYIRMTPSPLEQIESLEQLRVLWHGEKIHIETATMPPPVGIDTPEDLSTLLSQLSQNEA